MNFEEPEGATALDPNELDGLIPSHIVNRGQLNELEQHNILMAAFWVKTARFKRINEEKSLRLLHSKMFEKVWKWAGSFRKTEKNIGILPYLIPVELRNLCADVDAWIEFESYEPIEIAARFHHRLVSIHLFPNGNGRHARLATDILLTKQLGLARSTWGMGSLDVTGEIRKRYIEALQSADLGDYSQIVSFVST